MGADLDQKPNDESFGIDNIILSSNNISEKQACRIAQQKYQWVNLKPECRNNFSRIVLSQKANEKNEFANPCVLQTSSELRGGDGGVRKFKVVRESLAKGMVTFCDSVSGGGKCCKLGHGKHRKRLTKGKCPGNNRISYISIPEGCTVVVCTKGCGDKDTVHHYLGPGNHIPPEFPDNRISEAHVCVSCFLHTFIVRNHLANPLFSVQREHLYKSDKSKRTKLGIEEWNQGIEKLRGSNSSTIFNSFSREGVEPGAL